MPLPADGGCLGVLFSDGTMRVDWDEAGNINVFSRFQEEDLQESSIDALTVGRVSMDMIAASCVAKVLHYQMPTL